MARLTDTELVGYDCISLDYNERENNFSFDWRFKIRKDFDKVVFDTIQHPFREVYVSFCANFSGTTKILDVDKLGSSIDFDGNHVVMKGICTSRDVIQNDDVSFKSHYEYFYDEINVHLLNHSRMYNTTPYVFIYLGKRQG